MDFFFKIHLQSLIHLFTEHLLLLSSRCEIIWHSEVWTYSSERRYTEEFTRELTRDRQTPRRLRRDRQTPRRLTRDKQIPRRLRRDRWTPKRPWRDRLLTPRKLTRDGQIPRRFRRDWQTPARLRRDTRKEWLCHGDNVSGVYNTRKSPPLRGQLFWLPWNIIFPWKLWKVNQESRVWG